MATSSPQQIVQLEAPVMPEDPNVWISSLEEVIKHIRESMEAMKKVNENIASRLPPTKETGLEERRKTNEKARYQWVRETMKALSTAITIHLPREGKTLFIKGPTLRKLGRSNLIARNLTIVSLIIVGLAKPRTKKSRSMKMSRTQRRSTKDGLLH
jgi:hypothetical protein